MTDLGPTHYSWRTDVRQVVQRVNSHFLDVSCNTYVGHPWPGWDGRSIDVWAAAGRGHALSPTGAQMVRRFVLNLRDLPPVRHWILEHVLWTSWGGKTLWTPDDHSGSLRHFHITFW